jgi:hypothetical protein
VSALLLAVAGCTNPTPQPPPLTGTTVEGVLAVNGNPLPGGVIQLWGPNGTMGFGHVAEGGKYTVINAPEGPVTITVSEKLTLPIGPGAPMPQMPGPSLNDEQKKLLAEVDKKYGKNTPDNPLKYEVKKGAQTHDIELTIP